MPDAHAFSLSRPLGLREASPHASTERAGLVEKAFADMENPFALRQSLLQIPRAVYSQILS